MEILTISLLFFIAILSTYSAYRLSKQSILTSNKQNKIYIDTSVLIDGRIVDVARHGFLPGVIAISRAVLAELQYMADNADTEKRQRARHGLDVVKELQSLPGVTVELLNDASKERVDVDAHLRNLAVKYNGVLCTIDYNLIKVAEVEDIQILNVNDLALALRMSYLPGEQSLVELTTKGNDSKQAVGHLPDGTMVVVEDSIRDIGKTVEVEFIRSIQTSAGRMMFARQLRKQQTAKPPQTKGKPIKSSAKQVGGRRQDKSSSKAAYTKPQRSSRSSKSPTSRQSREDELIRLVNDQ